MGFAPTWLRQVSPTHPLLHKTTLTSGWCMNASCMNALCHEITRVMSSDVATFTAYIDTILSEITIKKEKCYIAGDYNVD